MFNMGFTEMLVIGVIALLFIGPKQLPEVARVIARLINEFRRATGDISRQVYDVQNTARKFVDDTKDEISKSVGVDDVKNSLHGVQEDIVGQLKQELDNIPDESLDIEKREDLAESIHGVEEESHDE